MPEVIDERAATDIVVRRTKTKQHRSHQYMKSARVMAELRNTHRKRSCLAVLDSSLASRCKLPSIGLRLQLTRCRITPSSNSEKTRWTDSIAASNRLCVHTHDSIEQIPSIRDLRRLRYQCREAAARIANKIGLARYLAICFRMTASVRQ